MRQGDILYAQQYDYKGNGEVKQVDVYYLVISNDWVNNNLREVSVLPVSPIYEPPNEKRRTHLVVDSNCARYLVQCEDIQHLHDAGKKYKVDDTVNKEDMYRVRKRLGWMFGDVKNGGYASAQSR